MAQTPDHSTYQAELYFQATAGEHPDLPFVPDRLERAGLAALPEDVAEYVAGGAGAERTVHANREAFDRWRLVARHMHTDISTRDLSVELFGRTLQTPLMLAPIGVLGSFVQGGERMVAQVCADLGVPWVVPTLSSASLEEVAEVMGDAPRLFQLYWQRDPDVTASFVRRAEESGAAAVVLTIDTQVPSWRPRDLVHGYHPLLGGEGIANHLADPAFQAQRDPNADDEYIRFEAAGMMGDPSRTWTDVAELCESTALPVVVKGVQHPDDVKAALDAGVSGIGVSNHGGRQLDGAIGSLDALPGIARAVDGRVPIIFDSGIRTGADVVKALALGADAVLIGRPYVWGLAAGREAGVRQVLRGLLAELSLTLGLVGRTAISELDPSVLVDCRT